MAPKRKATTETVDGAEAPVAKKSPKTPKTPKTATKKAADATNDAPPKPKRFPGQKKVEDLMIKAGLNPEELKERGNCYKAALARGRMEFSGNPEDLDKVIAETQCEECSDGRVIVTPRSLFHQQDYGGNDYEDGSEGGAGVCQNAECGAHQYYAGMCTQLGHWDSGKFSNHCAECSGYGTCIGDYRMAHCPSCKKHYWAGIDSRGCDKCSGRRPSTKEVADRTVAAFDMLAAMFGPNDPLGQLFSR